MATFIRRRPNLRGQHNQILAIDLLNAPNALLPREPALADPRPGAPWVAERASQRHTPTIGIDARAATEVPAGRGRVVRELLRALARARGRRALPALRPHALDRAAARRALRLAPDRGARTVVAPARRARAPTASATSSSPPTPTSPPASCASPASRSSTTSSPSTARCAPTAARRSSSA